MSKQYLFAICAIFNFSAYGTEVEPSGSKASPPQSQPATETLLAHRLDPAEQTTTYIYKNRIEYYDEDLVSQVKELNELPATSLDGVPFAEIFFTQFNDSDSIYLVQRGWTKDGNCRVSSSKLDAGGFVLTEDECHGDPCSFCWPFDPEIGCSCRAGFGERCNHHTGD